MMSQSQSQNKELDVIDSVGNAKCEKLKQRRKRKRRTNKVDIDDALRLQRRTRYLLIRMKVEQNLLDAYSTEGWKGQSREKIKPEKELQRAKKQILKCKLGIRDAIRQLDLLSSVGCIDDSAIAPDGSVHHDHIHCAKCKLREAFPDNDIILCDGTCNCAFHQMCIDPPLLTENIPPGDQGWFCKYCICKTEIIDAMNAHLGTSYCYDSHWQEIFKVEATLPDDGDTFLDQREWPSEDSEDDDYDPNGTEKFENIEVSSGGESYDDGASSSSSLWSLEDEVFDDEFGKSRKINTGLESTSIDFLRVDFDSDCENASGRRQRRTVDYRKLYDEMFGKDALANDEASEDEDWGPTKKKRREKESDAATTLMTLCETEGKCVEDDTILLSQGTKRSFFRIPPEAVEKLRLVFIENELPSRAVKEELSQQLGLESEKVSKWFKNARYLALKTRKSGEENSTQNEPEAGKNKAIYEMLSEDTPNNSRLKKFRRRKKVHSPMGDLYISTLNDQIANDVMMGDDDLCLKMLRGNAKNDKQEEEAEAKMERLCLLKEKLEKLQEVLRLRLPNRRSKNATPPNIKRATTVYVPVAIVKEKT